MSDIEVLLLAFGGNAALLLVLGFLARSLLSQLLTSDLKRFEDELAQRATTTVEQLRHSLGLVAAEHSVRFARLHERQAQALEEIYSRLLDFEDASALLALADDGTENGLAEFSLQKAEDARRQLAQHVRRSEILLPVEISALLHALLDRVTTLLSGCSNNLLDKRLADGGKGSVFPEAKNAWAAVHKYLETEAPVTRREVERAFRKRLGAGVE